MRYIRAIVNSLALLLCMIPICYAELPVIVMAYKDEAKPPLIGDKDDNTGVYLDMFTKAANMIGHRLEVKRLPKKRLYLQLEEGKLDFYPGSSFSNKRSEFLVFLENGLQTKEVLISRKGHRGVQNLDEISGTLLVDLGGSKENINEKYPSINTFAVASLSFEQSLSLITLGRVDYYIADIEEVENYAKEMGIESFEEIELKIHHDALGGMQAMYMGFSKHSPLMKLAENPDFNPEMPLSYRNTAVTADENSVAYQFHKALLELKANGDLARFSNKHSP